MVLGGFLICCKVTLNTLTTTLWSDIPGGQLILVTLFGLFVKIRSKMLLEHGRVISCVC